MKDRLWRLLVHVGKV